MVLLGHSARSAVATSSPGHPGILSPSSEAARQAGSWCLPEQHCSPVNERALNLSGRRLGDRVYDWLGSGCGFVVVCLPGAGHDCSGIHSPIWLVTRTCGGVGDLLYQLPPRRKRSSGIRQLLSSIFSGHNNLRQFVHLLSHYHQHHHKISHKLDHSSVFHDIPLTYP